MMQASMERELQRQGLKPTANARTGPYAGTNISEDWVKGETQRVGAHLARRRG